MRARQTERQKPFHFDQGRPAELSALRLIAQGRSGRKSECIEPGGAQWTTRHQRILMQHSELRHLLQQSPQSVGEELV